jgi:hypothetical protein
MITIALIKAGGMMLTVVVFALIWWIRPRINAWIDGKFEPQNDD